MEKFLFKRIEVWAVLLIGVFVFAATILFGALVRNVAHGFDSYGRAGRIAYALASVPSDVIPVLETYGLFGFSAMDLGDGGQFGSRQGWTVGQSASAPPLDGYLLFSRYDGDASHHVIELVDLTTGKIEYRTDINADALLDGANRDSKIVDFSQWRPNRFRATHPIVLGNGDLIFKDFDTPLLRTDACGNLQWRNEEKLFHHALEMDSDGDLWSPVHFEPTRIEGLSDTFLDDGIARVSVSGEILYSRSITEVFLENGLGNILFTQRVFDPDPIHLNDVEPVPSDGPFWRKGDVFLSLRDLSMIVLFRPSTDEIIWKKQGPWAGQHDVDVIDDHTIALFNNNMLNMGSGQYVDGTNEILLYDFATDTVSSPYKEIFEDFDIRTAIEGQFAVVENGYLLVENSLAGQYLVISPDGTLVAENINRADDGSIYHLGWSRFIQRGSGDKIRDAMKAQNCASE